jgi:hypothetical protein
VVDWATAGKQTLDRAGAPVGSGASEPVRPGCTTAKPQAKPRAGKLESTLVAAAGALLAAYLWFCRSTSRIVWLRPPPQAWGRGPVVLASWHGRLWACGLARPPGGITRCLVSTHRDGRRMGAIAAWFGLEPVFGSSRQGGLSAFLALARTLRDGGSVVIAPDGPVGPRCRARAGAVKLSENCGVPLLPCSVSARRVIELQSWDRLLIPLPFTTIYVVVGEPLAATSLTLLTLTLDELQRSVDVAAGRLTEKVTT